MDFVPIPLKVEEKDEGIHYFSQWLMMLINVACKKDQYWEWTTTLIFILFNHETS